MHFAVPLFAKRLPDAKVLEHATRDGRQRLADARRFILRRFNDDDGKRRRVGAQCKRGRRAAGAAANDRDVEGRITHRQ